MLTYIKSDSYQIFLKPHICQNYDFIKLKTKIPKIETIFHTNNMNLINELGHFYKINKVLSDIGAFYYEGITKEKLFENYTCILKNYEYIKNKNTSVEFLKFLMIYIIDLSKDILKKNSKLDYVLLYAHLLVCSLIFLRDSHCFNNSKMLILFSELMVFLVKLFDWIYKTEKEKIEIISKLINNIVDRILNDNILYESNKKEIFCILLNVLQNLRPQFYPNFTLNWFLIITNPILLNWITEQEDENPISSDYYILIYDFLDFIYPFIKFTGKNIPFIISKCLYTLLKYIACNHLNLPEYFFQRIYLLIPCERWCLKSIIIYIKNFQNKIKQNNKKIYNDVLLGFNCISKDYVERLFDSKNLELYLPDIMTELEIYNDVEFRVYTQKIYLLLKILKDYFYIENGPNSLLFTFQQIKGSFFCQVIQTIAKNASCKGFRYQITFSGQHIIIREIVNNITHNSDCKKIFYHLTMAIFKNSENFKIKDMCIR
ncbi:hypothetical protein HZS_3651 [Henneguya salminicola]|nr:hypothetical protein HZS_3651 [Henneguya salminicola]